MDEWTVSKEIDISLILAVLICTGGVILTVIKGWLHFHDRITANEAEMMRIHEMNEAAHKNFNKSLETMQKAHDKDWTAINATLETFATRIERAIERLGERLDGKADK